jgi:serine/threonine protein kinase
MRFGKWQILRELGAGGQATAYLALDAEKLDLEGMGERARHLVGDLAVAGTEEDNRNRAVELLNLIEQYVRRESSDASAVIKILHPAARQDPKALERLEREMEFLTHIDHPNLIRVLDANIRDAWFVTPYYPDGPLSQHLGRFAGNPVSSLAALIPLARAVAKLHEVGAIHRDIKPENIFVDGDRLILGDFGIVFFEDSARTRLSDTYENVGSRDWMPGWAMGMRIKDVSPAFDVFGLGKVLWAMLSGRTKMRLWYFSDPEFNLVEQYPYDPRMKWINRLLEGSVVERRQDTWPDTEKFADQLYRVQLQIGNGGQVINRNVSRWCTVCGGGTYRLIADENSPPAGIRNLGLNPVGRNPYRMFECANCGHVQLFKIDQNPPAWGEVR